MTINFIEKLMKFKILHVIIFIIVIFFKMELLLVLISLFCLYLGIRDSAIIKYYQRYGIITKGNVIKLVSVRKVVPSLPYGKFDSDPIELKNKNLKIRTNENKYLIPLVKYNSDIGECILYPYMFPTTRYPIDAKTCMPIEIVYDPKNPERYIIEQEIESHIRISNFLIFFSIAFICLGSYLTFR